MDCLGDMHVCLKCQVRSEGLEAGGQGDGFVGGRAEKIWGVSDNCSGEQVVREGCLAYSWRLYVSPFRTALPGNDDAALRNESVGILLATRRRQQNGGEAVRCGRPSAQGL